MLNEITGDGEDIVSVGVGVSHKSLHSNHGMTSRECTLGLRWVRQYFKIVLFFGILKHCAKIL